mgnify:CR=1 FL=1
MNRILRRAMQDSDRYVIEMDYADAKGNRTHRFVSPIRFMGSYRFLGLCLCREQPRQFQLSRCKNIRLVPACDVLMPAPIHYSHKILRLMAEDRKSGKLKNIEPDSKSQVTFEYIDNELDDRDLEAQKKTIILIDQAVNEAKMQVSNSPTNGYFLSAQSDCNGHQS